ncbi:MAG: hypothetical protein ACD_58C00010G0008 [uncultured bacterium]|nr:MAG: hypothetical protein ACD_58C00010G0008 [uncultured bacterium]
MEFFRGIAEKLSGKEKRDKEEWEKRRQVESREADAYMRSIDVVNQLSPLILQGSGMNVALGHTYIENCKYLAQFSRQKKSNGQLYSRANYAEQELCSCFVNLKKVFESPKTYLMDKEIKFWAEQVHVTMACGFDGLMGAFGHDKGSLESTRKYLINIHNSYGLDNQTRNYYKK